MINELILATRQDLEDFPCHGQTLFRDRKFYVHKTFYHQPEHVLEKSSLLIEL